MKCKAEHKVPRSYNRSRPGYRQAFATRLAGEGAAVCAWGPLHWIA